MQHVITNVAIYLDALQQVEAWRTTLSEAIDTYDEEATAPRGAEMLHQWEKSMKSPLMTKVTNKVTR